MSYLDSLKGYKETLESETFPNKGSWFVRLAGVSFENRQHLISQMNKDTKLQLERDRNNEYDFYAVKVMADIKNKWEHVGFIPKKENKKVATSLDKGVKMDISLFGITGDPSKGYTYGLTVTITKRN